MRHVRRGTVTRPGIEQRQLICCKLDELNNCVRLACKTGLTLVLSVALVGTFTLFEGAKNDKK